MFYTKIVMMNGCSHELQAQAGETVTSAYAVDSETMRKLYKFNMSFFQKKGVHFPMILVMITLGGVVLVSN